jgi:hypothetical protein
MTTSLRRSMWSAIFATICAVVLGASPLVFTPAASAHGGLTCEFPPYTTGGYVSVYCEGHGIATLVGYCGSRMAVNSTIFNHHGGFAWNDCSFAATAGPMTNITLTTSMYAEAPPEDPSLEEDPLPSCSSDEKCCVQGPDGECRECVPAHAACR